LRDRAIFGAIVGISVDFGDNGEKGLIGNSSINVEQVAYCRSRECRG